METVLYQYNLVLTLECNLSHDYDVFSREVPVSNEDVISSKDIVGLRHALIYECTMCDIIHTITRQTLKSIVLVQEQCALDPYALVIHYPTSTQSEAVQTELRASSLRRKSRDSDLQSSIQQEEILSLQWTIKKTYSEHLLLVKKSRFQEAKLRECLANSEAASRTLLNDRNRLLIVNDDLALQLALQAEATQKLRSQNDFLEQRDIERTSEFSRVHSTRIEESNRNQATIEALQSKIDELEARQSTRQTRSLVKVTTEPIPHSSQVDVVANVPDVADCSAKNESLSKATATDSNANLYFVKTETDITNECKRRDSGYDQSSEMISFDGSGTMVLFKENQYVTASDKDPVEAHGGMNLTLTYNISKANNNMQSRRRRRFGCRLYHDEIKRRTTFEHGCYSSN